VDFGNVLGGGIGKVSCPSGVCWYKRGEPAREGRTKMEEMRKKPREL